MVFQRRRRRDVPASQAVAVDCALSLVLSFLINWFYAVCLVLSWLGSGADSFGLQAGEGNEEEDDDGGVVWVQTDHGGGVHGHVPSGLRVNDAESGEDLVRLSSYFSSDLAGWSLVLITDLWMFQSLLAWLILITFFC